MATKVKITINELKDKSKSQTPHVDNIQIDYSNNNYIVYCTDDCTDDWKYETPCKNAALALIMFRIREAIEGIIEISTLQNQRFNITISARQLGINAGPIIKFNYDEDEFDEDEFSSLLTDYAQKVLKEMRVCVADILNIISAPMKNLLVEDAAVSD